MTQNTGGLSGSQISTACFKQNNISWEMLLFLLWLQECYAWLHFGKGCSSFLLVDHCGVSRNSSHKNKNRHHVLCIIFFEHYSFIFFVKQKEECTDYIFSSWWKWMRLVQNVSGPYDSCPILICLLLKAIIWLQETWNIVHKSYGLLFYDFYDAFGILLSLFFCFFFWVNEF